MSCLVSGRLVLYIKFKVSQQHAKKLELASSWHRKNFFWKITIYALIFQAIPSRRPGSSTIRNRDSGSGRSSSPRARTALFW